MANYFPLFVARDAPSAAMSSEPVRRLVRRVFDALAQPRAQRLDREVAQYIEGWGLTDSVERDIEWRFLSRL